MNGTAFRRILAVETRLFLRDRAAVLVALGLPTAILVVLGLIPALRRADPMFGGRTFVGYFAPSLLVVSMAVSGVNLLAQTLAGYRERGVLRRLATTPVHPATLLAAQLVLNVAVMVLSALLVVVVGRLAFDVPLPRRPVGFTVVFGIGAAALLALGLLVAAVARSSRSAGGLSSVLFMTTMFVGGVYVPRFLLPDVVARLGDYTPPGVQALLDAWTGTSPRPLPLAIMAVVALAAGAAAARLFRWE
ncbi:ABC transporter permease [Micromonospora auratinigra]|uniref:ABC-2 type transport system permease protein n=1 Tax=Micromonospora auratinigra TaxID=261654 RepID=A0A1A8Z6Y1_9ACTN|nr:ABC transporter permease [Micromonospora auratinigra]SBT39586.1 ABC-2 type transport system permease protein [Micromonospora auratinigra]